MNGLIETSTVPMECNGALQNNVPTPEVHPNRRKKKKSDVWQHFSTQPVSENCTRARCNKCNRSFVYINGKKQSGTSHLRRHIGSGACQLKRADKKKEEFFPCTSDSQNGAFTAPPRKRCQASPGTVTVVFDTDHSVHDLARMIIQHDYPINMVEHPGFIDFTRSLQPSISVASSSSIQSEIMTVFRREKRSLVSVLAEIPGRVSLTLEVWTTDQNVGYAMLTGHFVDANWTLQRRVLNFHMVPFPNSEVAYNNAIATCLSEWNLESRLFAFTLDHSFATEAVVGHIRGILSMSNPHMLNGQLLMDHCYARVIGCLAQDALSSMSEAVSKVRDSVKFVKSSESREGMFKKLTQQLQVPCTKNLVLDYRDKWDSTYHMLSTACELKEVFSCLDTSDSNYDFVFTMDDWKSITTLCAYLKLFYDSTNILMAETYPAAHIYFHEVYRIQFELAHGAFSDDRDVSDLVRPLSEKFDVYWRDCCGVLAMAVTMDPRYKSKLVRYTLTKLYGEDEGDKWAKKIDESLHDLYFEYVAQTLPLPSIHVDQRFDEFIRAESLEDELAPPSSSGDDDLSDFDIYISDFSNSHQMKSELDQYLDEDLLPREELDVIGWWKFNRIKYPTLSKMAADLLSIPFSTVHRNSVFDTKTQKLDSYQSSMKPSHLEAMICAKDWLQSRTQQSSSMFDMVLPLAVKKTEHL